MAAFKPDCFPSSSCLHLYEYWNLVPNNTNICIKKRRHDCQFKAWCSLSVPQCTVSPTKETETLDACIREIRLVFNIDNNNNNNNYYYYNYYHYYCYYTAAFNVPFPFCSVLTIHAFTVGTNRPPNNICTGW